jgi:integrase
LTEDELSALQALDLPAGSVLERHRDLYVFACYAGGIRVGDLLRLEWRNFDGERIKLVTMKTKDALSIKLSRTALDIIEKLPPASCPQDFLFGLMPNDLDRSSAHDMHKAVSGTTAHINKNLKILAERARIDKRVTFHTSRHTWATRALRKGMPIQYVSKLLGHSSIRMTEHYVKIVNLDLDQAMEVFD